MPANASVDLSLRRVPVQKRGRRTFEAILDAAAVCLREQGVGNLSTNMIAERAGVNIARHKTPNSVLTNAPEVAMPIARPASPRCANA